MSKGKNVFYFGNERNCLGKEQNSFYRAQCHLAQQHCLYHYHDEEGFPKTKLHIILLKQYINYHNSIVTHVFFNENCFFDKEYFQLTHGNDLNAPDGS
jgi:hypothetical protein